MEGLRDDRRGIYEMTEGGWRDYETTEGGWRDYEMTEGGWRD